MANCDIGVFASCVCFIASLCTMALGIALLVQKIEGLKVRFEECEVLEAECDQQWRFVFSLQPDVFLDLWTPTIFGVLGVSVHVNCLRLNALCDRLLPTGYMQYAFFMLATALFGNVGYCGKLGVIFGAISGAACLACVLVRLAGEQGIKMLQTKL